MQLINALATLALTTAALVDKAAAQPALKVTLFAEENFQGDSKTFNAATPGTCYNLNDCFTDKTASAQWTLPLVWFEPQMLTFYDAADCKGIKYVVPYDDIFPTSGVSRMEAGLSSKASSFSTFTYATGITKYSGFQCSGNETDAIVQPTPVTRV